MTPNEIRIFRVLLDDTVDLHRALVGPSETYPSHTALYEDDTPFGPDLPCLTCGHINEAEYTLAEAEA